VAGLNLLRGFRAAFLQRRLNMENYQSNYERRPLAERRAAEKYAKKLLRTVPALQDPDRPVSLGRALDTGLLKAEDVMAARVYPDAENQWWFEVTLCRDDELGQLRNDTPLARQDQAVAWLEYCIGNIKGAYQLLSELRKLGIDPKRVERLGIRHDSFGVRWVVVPTNEISTRARAFAEEVELKNGPFVDKLVMAFIFLYDMAPKFVAGPLLLAADGNSDVSKEWFDHCLDAASFALKQGVGTIYDLSEEPNSAALRDDLDFGLPTARSSIDQRGEDQCIGGRPMNA
jgi:hypothetical protein